jgi:hypothetical protein
MVSAAIAPLLAKLREKYFLAPYGGDSEDGHGTGFKIAGIAATFSVHTRDGTLPEGTFDIQIEGVPPGEYLYANVVSLETLLTLVERMSGPRSKWP